MRVLMYSSMRAHFLCACVCVSQRGGGTEEKEKVVKADNASDRRRKSLLWLILDFRETLDLENT